MKFYSLFAIPSDDSFIDTDYCEKNISMTRYCENQLYDF